MLGYGACPHWTLSRSLLGLPIVGPFDKTSDKLPLKLITGASNKMQRQKSVVEIHPGLAAWLWCRGERGNDANWVYKGSKAEMRRIRDEMWEIILDRSGFENELPHPGNDDEFDAAVGYILGKLFVQSGEQAPRSSLILGNSEHGSFLLPNIPGLADAWLRWKDTNSAQPKTKSQRMDADKAATGQADEPRENGVRNVSQFASGIGSRVKDSATAALNAGADTASAAADTAGKAFHRAKAGPKRALSAATDLADEILVTVQGLLASSLAIELNELLQQTVKGSATIYDKAMDAEYLRTATGGGNHRMFDGGHTLAGAWEAVRNASPDDTFIEEALGYVEALFKDLTTPKGLPIASWDKSAYDQVANDLQSSFGIPKDWFYDINSFDAPELLAGVIGFASVVFSWNEEDTEKFAKLVGNMGVAAVFSANPILLVITLTSMARAFHKAEHSGEYVEAVDGLLKGGINTGATLAAATQVAVFGGPAGLTLLAGLSAGILANRATKKISVVQMRQFIMERTTSAAMQLKEQAKALPPKLAEG